MSSDFFYNTIVSGLTVEWLINSTVSLELYVVEHLRQRFSFALADGTFINTNARSSTGVAVGISVLF